MRIGVQTWGSEGDIRPFIALAGGLARSGHEVTLALTCIDDKDFSPYAAKLGFTLHQVATPVIADPLEIEAAGLACMKPLNPLKQVGNIMDLLFNPALAEMTRAAGELASSSDLIVRHCIHHPAAAAAERAGVPDVAVTLTHSTVPSRHSNLAGVPSLAGLLTPMWWRVVRAVMNSVMLSDVNEHRRAMGLAQVRDLLLESWASRHLTLVGVSPTMCQRQPDWPASHHVCGFLNIPDAAQPATLPEGLEAFLSSGEPPVYMGFGSMTPPHITEATNTYELFRDATRRAGVRAVIQMPASLVREFPSDKTVHVTGPVPHMLIFPRCAAVVHHGGSGTTQTALRCGVPSIVVFHIVEQRFWGSELRRLGIAPVEIPRRSVTSKKLARRIIEVMQSPRMSARAKELGNRVAREDGVGEAVRIINERFKR